MSKAFFHLPGLFEFHELYKVFLPLYFDHREYFYDWCDIGSIYGSPDNCIWSGGRVELSDSDVTEVVNLMKQYGISARLTFSNSLLKEEHLNDIYCNKLCKLFETAGDVKNGIIIHSDLLMEYLKERYPDFYYVSSTTKVLTKTEELIAEIDRKDFRYVVPDFRFNKNWNCLNSFTDEQKSKIEFLCNECCSVGCNERKECYEEVSRKNLGIMGTEHLCSSVNGAKGYRFSEAMNNPSFISVEDICNHYVPAGFKHYKIEGRGLGSALVLEFLLYYMTKPEYQIHVREAIYLDNMLDIF